MFAAAKTHGIIVPCVLVLHNFKKLCWHPFACFTHRAARLKKCSVSEHAKKKHARSPRLHLLVRTSPQTGVVIVWDSKGCLDWKQVEKFCFRVNLKSKIGKPVSARAIDTGIFCLQQKWQWGCSWSESSLAPRDRVYRGKGVKNQNATFLKPNSRNTMTVQQLSELYKLYIASATNTIQRCVLTVVQGLLIPFLEQNWVVLKAEQPLSGSLLFLWINTRLPLLGWVGEVGGWYHNLHLEIRL